MSNVHYSVNREGVVSPGWDPFYKEYQFGLLREFELWYGSPYHDRRLGFYTTVRRTPPSRKRITLREYTKDHMEDVDERARKSGVPITVVDAASRLVFYVALPDEARSYRIENGMTYRV